MKEPRVSIGLLNRRGLRKWLVSSIAHYVRQQPRNVVAVFFLVHGKKLLNAPKKNVVQGYATLPLIVRMIWAYVAASRRPESDSATRDRKKHHTGWFEIWDVSCLAASLPQHFNSPKIEEGRLNLADQVTGVRPLQEVVTVIAALSAGQVTRAALDHTR